MNDDHHENGPGPATHDMLVANALRVTRLIWVALIAGQIGFLTVIGVLFSTGFQLNAGPDVVQLLAMLWAAMFIPQVAAAFFLRTTTYAKNRTDDGLVAPASYQTGNLLFLAILEGAAMFALVITLLAGTFVPYVGIVFLPLAIQVLNYPNGRAMLPDPMQMP